ncbi:MAG TPA: acetyl-CoA carboxylase biotin carboxyl carrier protein subunit [Fimbriimonas sp.]
MADGKETIDALASLMNEFHLSEARIRRGNIRVAFHQVALQPVEGGEPEVYAVPSAPAPVESESPKGMPITSPMNGIFYTSPSPTSAAFVKEGDSVTAGQVVGLIEAMKVFNEITSPLNGVVLKIAVESGQVVQPGDTLLLIG